MKKIYLLIILFAIYWPSNAQAVYPGGVSGVSVWYRSSLNASFDGNKYPVSFPLETGQGKSIGIFTVYRHAEEGKEQMVWSIENETSTALVMTTQRLGNLKQYEYINYTNTSEPQYRILTYTLNEPVTATDGRNDRMLFRIGKQPSGQTLPVKDFTGNIPEIILYDRPLNPNERQRIESYLAVKYGIPLDQTFPTSYLNSDGNVIWDAYRESLFNHNITAIGRDDRSGLLQTTSTSGRESGLLQVSLADKSELPDKHFIFFADNGGELQFKPHTGAWKPCSRVWKIWETADSLSKGLVAEFDLTRFPLYFTSVAKRYALLVDRSGRGDFSEKETVIAEATPEGNRLRFTGVNLYGSGASPVFSLAVDSLPEVQRKVGSNFACLSLAPNPTPDGNFRLDIGLHKESAVEIKIFNSVGALVSGETLSGSSSYIYKGRVPQTGFYIIQLTSNGTGANLKLVRN